MSLLAIALVVVLLIVVVFVVSAPVRAAGRRQHPEPPQPATAAASVERDQLEAAREAKYREIRDAELDYRTGKLSREDYEAVDGLLRREALEILDRLEGS